MEKFQIGNTEVRMILIKNPAGCNQVLNFLSEMTEPFVFTVTLNDRTQDGKDISWIWDVDFEKLTELKDLLKTVYVSGIRADEMAMRFYYAGFPAEKIRVIRDYDALTSELEKECVPVYVMPTYTAMLDMRAYMSKKYKFGAYWE
jgi:UDP-N-acetylmuramyl tripeptide synthase